MLTAFIRTVIIYVTLNLSMRLMGKRQIGELELSELITTLLISEIASLPITESTIPVSRAMIPIVTLLAFELISSALTVRFPRVSKFLTTRPTTLIKDGMMIQKNMLKSKVSTEELICELRQNGVGDISEVMYAILEQNGKISVLPKATARPPTSKELKLNVKETGIYHIVIDKSVINKHALNDLDITRERIDQMLKLSGTVIDDVYLMVINDRGEYRIIRKDKN